MATKKTQGARTTHSGSSASRTGPGAGKRITARDLKSFRRRLEDELTVLTGRHAGLEAASATGQEGAGAGYGEEASDAGSFTSERERDLSLVGNLRDLIEKIQGALGRIDDGSYGRCEVCGQPIEAERLDALPYTTLCLADARRRARVR
jgi:DnaK suppressor protein